MTTHEVNDMTQKNTSRIVGMALALTLVAAPAAYGADAANDEGPEIRVVNNHAYQVSVVVIDERGVYHSLGRVSPKDARIFTLADAEVASGDVQVKVFVDEPVWSLGNSGEAVRSSSLRIEDGAALQVWVEPDLTATQLELVQ